MSPSAAWIVAISDGVLALSVGYGVLLLRDHFAEDRRHHEVEERNLERLVLNAELQREWMQGE